MRNRFLAITAFLIFASTCFARDIVPPMGRSRGTCNDIIKECLAFVDAKRLTCFGDATASPSCTRTLHRTVLALRTGIVDDRLEKIVKGKLLDQGCVAVFDSQLSSIVAKDSQNPSELQALVDGIKQCWIDAPMDLAR